MLKLFVSMQTSGVLTAIALQTHVTGVLNRDRGATAVEYGLLVGLIALVIIAIVVTLGTKLDDIFTDVNTQLPTQRHLIREFARGLPSTADGGRKPAHEPDIGREQPAMRRRTARNTPRDRGAAAVEFALLLPVLLLLVFGIIDFGRALNASITLTQAAREGARLAAVAERTGSLTRVR